MLSITSKGSSFKILNGTKTVFIGQKDEYYLIFDSYNNTIIQNAFNNKRFSINILEVSKVVINDVVIADIQGGYLKITDKDIFSYNAAILSMSKAIFSTIDIEALSLTNDKIFDSFKEYFVAYKNRRPYVIGIQNSLEVLKAKVGQDHFVKITNDTGISSYINIPIADFNVLDDQIATLSTPNVINNNISSFNNSISIPKPIIEMNVFDDVLKYSPPSCYFNSKSDSFLKYNPEIWIFVDRGKARGGKKKGFRHPSHLDGSKYIGSNLYAGEQFDSLGNLITRNTEFPIPSEKFKAYDKVMIEFNPLSYFNLNGTDELLPSDLPLAQKSGFNFLINKEVVRRGSTALKPKQRKDLKIKFAYVIDNPENDPNKPKIIGPLSDTITYRMLFTSILDTLDGFIGSLR